MLKFLLLLLFLLPKSEGCPQECTCSQRSVDCSAAFLWVIPQTMPEGVISLDLANNNLTILPDDVFQSVSSLVTLLVHSSGVETVEPDAFRGLSVLGFLDLHNNRISYLHPGLFRHNHALSSLNLSGNRIRNIIGGIFSNNPVISQVHLTGNPLDSTVNWLTLGSFTSLSLGSQYCEPSYSVKSMFPTSKVFDSISLESIEFKGIGITNIIVYLLGNMTWAVLETHVTFPVLCFCNQQHTWILCGQEASSMTTCTTPWMISEVFGNTKCEHLDTQRHLTSVPSTEVEVQENDVTASQDESSTPQAPNHKRHLTVDKNFLVMSLAIAGVLVIVWVVAYLVFFHGKRKKRQRNSTAEVSSSFLPGGSPLSLPDNFAFNRAAAARQSATPDVTLAVNGDRIVYSSLNSIGAMPNLDAHHLYSEVEDRIDDTVRKN